MKAFVIVNPTAGRGKSLQLLPQIEAKLDELGIENTIHISDSPASPPELARQALSQGYPLIVAGGGDGTAQAVASALLGTSAILGLLPMGRGNDFVRGLDIPSDPVEACKVLRDGVPSLLDVGKSGGGQFFVNVAGAGFDAEVNRYANRIRWFRGRLVYLVAIFVKLLTFRTATFTLEHDGGNWQGKAMMVAVANASYYGGGLFIAPDALVNDGLFDVTIIGDLGRLEFLRAFPTVYKGTHIHHPKVQTLRTRRIRLSCDAPYCSYADGDFLSDLPLSLEVQPQALRVMLPAAKSK